MVRRHEATMSERRAFLAFLFVVLLVWAGLIHRDREQLQIEKRQFESNQALWEASNLSNYDFSIRHFAAWSAPPPMRIVVIDGTVKSAVLLCLPPLTEAACKSWKDNWKEQYGPNQIINHAKSISQLYELVTSRRKSDPDARVHMVFDPTHGFPTRFSIDNPETADDEYGFEIFHFTVTQ